MKRPRFSIRSLLLIVLLVGVAVAALREATDLWDSALFGLALLVLLTAVLLTIHCTHRLRSFWLGFALFGWAYLGASLVPPVESRLPTTKGLAFLDSKVPRQETESRVLYRLLVSGIQGHSGSPQPVAPDLTTMGAADRAYSWMLTGAALPGPNGTTENFVRIGHSLLALVVGYFGGSLSRWMYDRDDVGTCYRTRP